MTKNKIAIAIALLLTLIAGLLVPYAQIANADYQNYAYITVAPDLVGVGQTVTVLFFQTIPCPTASEGFNPATNWNNYNVLITTPTGKTENFGPYTSDATGGAFFTYTPNEIGTYKLDFTFPGQTVVKGPKTFVFKPSSATTNFTVQEEPLSGYQTPPIPTDYWTRPIYGENRGWYVIGGNWLRSNYNNTGTFNPYTTAPNTAHIVWARNQYMGGVVGGDMGDRTYYQAPTYQSYWVPPIIISGRLYYMERQVPGNGWVGLHCVDMRTGEELWFRDVSKIGGAGGGGGGVSMNIYGQVFDGEGVNGHGVEPFIWNLGANWTVFDANSGTLVYTIANPLVAFAAFAAIPGTSGPHLLTGGVDPVGSIIAFYINGQNNWLLKWNSTKLLVASGIDPIANLYAPPVGAVLNWTNGIEWNVTIPDRPGRPGFYLGVPASNGDVVYAQTADIIDAVDNFTLCAFSTKDGSELWYKTFGDPFTPGSTIYQFFGPVKDGIMTVYNKNTAQWYGFNAYSGVQIWGPSQKYTNAWDTFQNSVAAYGKLFVGTYAGRLYCHDLTTGDLEWTYTLPPGGYETPYGTYSLSGGITVADGKLYAITGEHTPNSPYWKGGAMYCVNATTGELVYKISGWWSSSPAVVDGYALDHNCYDGTIYSFGKGPTSVTLAASPKVAVHGESVLIEGTVLDQSPGLLNYAGDRQSSKGTAAIADESMTEWMEYLYQQKLRPANATGVEVVISVIDPNNNAYEVGRTTSDSDGFFKTSFVPEVPGEYTVIASFAGSESYWSSSAKTAINIEEATTTTPQPTQAPASLADQYLLPGIGAVIAAIAVVGALILISLRKK